MSIFNVWDVGVPIIVEIFIVDPNSGLGLSGQAGYITLTIKRDLDNKYWSGSAWTTTYTPLTVTETNATLEPGRYIFTLPAVTGNYTATRYVMHTRILNPPIIEADAYEVHLSRSFDVKIYESEPA